VSQEFFKKLLKTTEHKRD